MENSAEAQDAVTPPLPPALALPAQGWGRCRGPGPRAEGGRAQPSDSQAGKRGRAHAGPGQAARATLLLGFSNTHPEFCFSSSMTFRSHLSSLEKKGPAAAQVQTQEERRQGFLRPDRPVAAWRPETLLSSEGRHLGTLRGRSAPAPLPPPARATEGPQQAKGELQFWTKRFAIKGAVVPCWLRAR